MSSLDHALSSPSSIRMRKFRLLTPLIQCLRLPRPVLHVTTEQDIRRDLPSHQSKSNRVNTLALRCPIPRQLITVILLSLSWNCWTQSASQKLNFLIQLPDLLTTYASCLPHPTSLDPVTVQSLQQRDSRLYISPSVTMRCPAHAMTRLHAIRLLIKAGQILTKVFRCVFMCS